MESLTVDYTPKWASPDEWAAELKRRVFHYNTDCDRCGERIDFDSHSEMEAGAEIVSEHGKYLVVHQSCMVEGDELA